MIKRQIIRPDDLELCLACAAAGPERELTTAAKALAVQWVDASGAPADRAALIKRMLFAQMPHPPKLQRNFAKSCLALVRAALETLRRRLKDRADRGEDAQLFQDVQRCLSFDPESRLIARLALRDPLKALERQAPETHRVLVMRRFEGMKLREIVEATSLSMQNVRTHLRYAQAFLRERVS